MVLAPGRAVAETTLQFQADAGTPQSLDVYLSAPVAGPWEWKTTEGDNGVTSFERLPVPEAAAALSALAARDGAGGGGAAGRPAARRVATAGAAASAQAA